MPSSTPLVAFIIGFGPNIGGSVASLLKEQGYTVAVGSRKPDVDKVKKEGYFPVQVDATQQASISAAFAAVNAELGPPSVVVYNRQFPPAVPVIHREPTDVSDPSTLPLEAFNDVIAIGSNVFVAIQEALKGFRSSKHEDTPKAFIVTGNVLPADKALSPFYFSLDIQKIIESRIVGQLARANEKTGIQFAYATLVADDGGIPPYDLFLKSGDVHAKVYWELINRKEGPWDYRFTLDGKKLANYESL
ncbi:hypothetical protein PC9H_011623 [Pleurotus ostreatus]|uniref:Uncharacterized protein n=1 Tax=Pleurotus ostreatus TaxID=5322 RepID=A0A8H6ZM57_PLEOS|nr:uncharacterized protein PC9H_011623 [Pleurotus ostreatus]KAF7421103.1 hypothetical protein PC9H_011623 [Pleurotus ostreatus]